MKSPKPNNSSITLADIDAYFGGQADEATKALVVAAMEQPDSEVREYVAWLNNPPAYKARHGGPPLLVVEDLARVMPALAPLVSEMLAEALAIEAGTASEHPNAILESGENASKINNSLTDRVEHSKDNAVPRTLTEQLERSRNPNLKGEERSDKGR